MGWGDGGLFDYSVISGPFFWKFDTESDNMKVKKSLVVVVDYSVTPGPVFWEFDTEFWVQSLDLGLDLTWTHNSE